MKNIIVIFLSAVAFWACSGHEEHTNEKIVARNVDSVPAMSHKVSKELMASMLQSIPSPLELSNLIKKSGGSYDATLLNPSENIGNYNTSYKRALNLGIYGTDLGYINIYNNSKDALFYLNSVKTMADGLNIGQFFDFNTLKRLSQNSENMDSLLYISTSNYEKINSYLHDQRRSDQSILILTGGWVEAMHLLCQVAQKKEGNITLMEKIGEQQVVLNQLILLLTYYENDPNIKMLLEEFKELKKIYDTVIITQTYKGSEMKEVNGILTIDNKTESKIIITKDQVAQISTKIEAIRSKIIN